MSVISRRSFLVSTAGIFSALPSLCYGQDMERQPFLAGLKQVLEALEALGQPIRLEDRKQLAVASALSSGSEFVSQVRQTLAKYVLLRVSINPEGRVSVTRGAAPAVLVEGGWTVYCLEIANNGALTAQLQVTSPQALPVSGHSPGSMAATPTGVMPLEAQLPVQTQYPPLMWGIVGWTWRSSTSLSLLRNCLDYRSSTASFSYTVAITAIAKHFFP